MAAPALNSDNRNCDSRRDSVRGISWKFEIRQTHALIGNLVGANARGRLKSECSAIRDVIVFIHSVAANTEPADKRAVAIQRSEEHTSELQSQSNLVCRLLLEKKNTTQHTIIPRPRSATTMNNLSRSYSV